MTYATFKSFLEAQDATAVFKPSANTGYINQQSKKTFKQEVDPLIQNFAQRILNNVLNSNAVQLQPVQVQYILEKLQTELSKLGYNSQNDLGNIINTYWKQSNQPYTPNNIQQNNTQIQTPFPGI